MALTRKEPIKQTTKSNKPKRTRTHIITLNTSNVLIETRTMILYQLCEDKIWLPKQELWINQFLTDTFILPIYEKDNLNCRVVYKDSKEDEYVEYNLIDICNEILKDQASFAGYAIVTESKSKTK